MLMIDTALLSQLAQIHFIDKQTNLLLTIFQEGAHGARSLLHVGCHRMKNGVMENGGQYFAPHLTSKNFVFFTTNMSDHRNFSLYQYCSKSVADCSNKRIAYKC